MCLAVYLGSNHELELSSWNNNNPSFHISKILKNKQTVKKHFSLLYIYCIGLPWTCGCGTTKANHSKKLGEFKNRKEDEIKRKTIDKLIAVIKENRVHSDYLELYTRL